jgi:hypothetical protein
MTTLQSVSSFLVPLPAWSADWAWGLPLIVLTVIIHVLGLGLIRQKAVRVSKSNFRHRHQTALFAAVMGTITLLATALHAVEASLWAVAYRLLRALPDARSAMLYSLNAITSYGHIGLTLQEHWHLMGALEALNGWLLFGLTTAFLFAMIEQFRLDRG